MDTRPLQMLSGAEIVDRGRNVSNCILPEVGTKEMEPNGSWLEVKQIQTALEKRKSLVAAERIDKVGALSHAEWRDELKQAEVTQQVGGHWQYMGHNVNGTFFLLPEETLYLIETNCLLLKHNQVTVSLQKAYGLLLEDNKALTRYKVYSSLSRVGHKVFRHNKLKPIIDNTIESTETNHVNIPLKVMESSSLFKEKLAKTVSTECSNNNLPHSNGNTKNGNLISSERLTCISNTKSESLPGKEIITNGSKTLSGVGIDHPLPTNDILNKSETPLDIQLSSDTAVKIISAMVIHPPLVPIISNNAAKTSDLMPTGCNNETTIDTLLPKRVVGAILPPPPPDTHMAIDLPLADITSIDEPKTSDSVPTDCNVESTIDTLLPKDVVEEIHLPLLPDIDMVIDLPLADTTSNNESKTSDSVPLDCNVESTINTLLPKNIVEAIHLPHPPDTNMAIDLPLVDMTSNNESKTLDSVPTDCNVESTIDTQLPKIVKAILLTHPPDTDMVIDMPLEDMTSNNESKTSDSVPTDCNVESTIDTQLPKDVKAIPLTHPPDTDMVINMPLEDMTSNNESKTSDSVPTICESTIDKLLPKEVVKTKEHVLGVLSIDKLGVIRSVAEEASDIEMKTVSSFTKTDTEKKNNSSGSNKPEYANIYQITRHKINKRKIQLTNPKSLQDKFNDIPDCYNQQTVTIKVPSEEFLPRNVFLNNTSYVLNLKSLKNIKRSKSTVENRALRRTIRNSSESESAAVPMPEMPQYLPNTSMYQHPYGYYPHLRHFPRQHFNQHPYFYRIMHFMPQHFNYNRPPPPYNHNRPPPPYNHNRPPPPRNNCRKQNQRPQNQRQKRPNVKGEHLNAIKNLALKLKMLPRLPRNSLNSLKGLMARFNEIYNERMRITHDLLVVSDDQENVVTIELDDDEDQSTKCRPDTKSTKYDKYLESLKTLAARLKNIDKKSQSVPRQKRAFQHLLKKFNEAFNTDLYLDSKGDLKDNKLVVLDSSSDSDVVATEDVEQTHKKRRSNGDSNDVTKHKKRKLVNPFHILKKVNEGASTSRLAESPVPDKPVEDNFTELLNYFDKNWLPGDDDFGKAIFCPKMNTQHLFSDSQQLYDFADDSNAFENWIDLKLSFCDHMEAVFAFEQHLTEHSNDLKTDKPTLKSTLKSILVQDPNVDWAASLEKLRIIQTATDVQETCLTIDFDVYNRDVQNFRKTDPPRPHFRVVCVDESSKFPSGAEVKAVHNMCDDNVNTVFAVVGIDSISYLKMNPKDLPINVGND